MLGKVARVVALVRGAAHDERHQHRGDAGRAQLADGDRAGAADDEIGLGEPARHVVDERQHLGFDAGGGVGRGDLGLPALAALVRHARALRGIEPRQRRRQHAVERLRAEAAADDQQRQRAQPRGVTRGRRRQRLDLGTHRVAGDHRQPDRRCGRTVEAEGDAVGHRQQRAVAQQQPGVGVDQHQRLAQQRGHHAAGEADVAAHAEHHGRAAPAQDRQAVGEGLHHPHAAGQRVQRALAAQAGEADGVERDAGRRHQAVFQARARAQPAHAPAALLHLLRDRQPGDDVPAGARGHDQQMAHARPPRMSWALWLRPARCARFTSLRDMSLRRSRALMRGLRASAPCFRCRRARRWPGRPGSSGSPNRRSSSAAASGPWSAARRG